MRCLATGTTSPQTGRAVFRPSPLRAIGLRGVMLVGGIAAIALRPGSFVAVVAGLVCSLSAAAFIVLCFVVRVEVDADVVHVRSANGSRRFPRDGWDVEAYSTDMGRFGGRSRGLHFTGPASAKATVPLAFFSKNQAGSLERAVKSALK